MNDMTPEQAAEIFPTECHFKIITYDVSGVADRLNRVLIDKNHPERVRPGHHSTGGKYLTYNVSLVIETLEIMRELDNAFRSVDGVRMVL